MNDNRYTIRRLELENILDDIGTHEDACIVGLADEWNELEEIEAMLDNRYTIRREFCGYPEARWVVRFCGEWVGQSANKADAIAIAESFEQSRWE